jgi:hypothetical protein
MFYEHVGLQLQIFLLLWLLSLPPWAAATTPKVLIYSATAQFRHDSIPTAIEALMKAGAETGLSFDPTEDHTRFSANALSQYDAILFLSTTGESMALLPFTLHHIFSLGLVLDDVEQKAFQAYLNAGGNFIGIHASADCLVNTSFYGRETGELLHPSRFSLRGHTFETGAYFDYHPPLQNYVTILSIISVSSASHVANRLSMSSIRLIQAPKCCPNSGKSRTKCMTSHLPAARSSFPYSKLQFQV